MPAQLTDTLAMLLHLRAHAQVDVVGYDAPQPDDMNLILSAVAQLVFGAACVASSVTIASLYQNMNISHAPLCSPAVTLRSDCRS